MDKELEKELLDIFEGFLNSIDFKYHYEDSDGNVIDYPEKQTSRTCDCKKKDTEKQDKFDNKKDVETIDALKKLLSEKYKEINDLKKKNQELLELSKQGSITSHKMFDEGKRQRNLLKKKVYADGYRLVAEIKSFIEFARECELLDDVNFTDPLKMIRKTVNDFNSTSGRLS